MKLKATRRLSSAAVTFTGSFLPKAEKLYLTEIEAECPDADAYFPAFNKDEYKKSFLQAITTKAYISHISVIQKNNNKQKAA